MGLFLIFGGTINPQSRSTAADIWKEKETLKLVCFASWEELCKGGGRSDHGQSKWDIRLHRLPLGTQGFCSHQGQKGSDLRCCGEESEIKRDFGVVIGRNHKTTELPNRCLILNSKHCRLAGDCQWVEKPIPSLPLGSCTGCDGLYSEAVSTRECAISMEVPFL